MVEDDQFPAQHHFRKVVAVSRKNGAKTRKSKHIRLVHQRRFCLEADFPLGTKRATTGMVPKRATGPAGFHGYI